jgi:chromosome partitioning protein
MGRRGNRETSGRVRHLQKASQGAFVINRKITNTAIGRDVVKALNQYPQPVLKSAISQRVAFAESARGRTVLELDAESAASNEVQLLAKEVLRFAS